MAANKKCNSTPWLTTRRRTCPICKGDVVRSMSEYLPFDDTEEEAMDYGSTVDIESRNASSAPAGVSHLGGGEQSDHEQHTDEELGVDERNPSSFPQTAWRNISSLRIPFLNSDAWHQSRDRDR